MGQKQVINAEASQKNDAVKVPSFTEAQISLDDESVVRPNGYFPPEIIVLVLKYADFATCVRSSQSCKLWYESIRDVFRIMYISRYGTLESLEDNWKVNFYRRTLMDQNLAKGSWWAEALSSFHYPKWDTFSYVASFEGNKVIFNNHHIHITSYSDSKFFEAAYELDLETMNRVAIQYGTIFANGFKIRTLIRNDYEDFDWKEYEVEDGTTTRTIKRKFEPPPATEYWRRTQYRLFVNKDGSPTVLTVNEFRQNYHMEGYTRHGEVVDLRTGDIIAEPKFEADQIIAFLGDTVIAAFPDGLFFANIYTNERMPLDPADTKCIYYCKDSHTLGLASKTGVITFYDWPSLQQVSQIDVKAKLEPPNLDTDTGGYYEYGLRGFAFDKSKLVVAMGTQSTFYAVFDKHTGELIQTFYNNTDAEDPRICEIHLAPNGKIVTDCSNLTVYDFASPMIYKQIPLIYTEVNSSEVTKIWVPATSLAKYVAGKLGVGLPCIQHVTFFGKTKTGQQYRITGIGSHGNDRDDWDQWRSIDWKDLSLYLSAWRTESEVRNTFQMTLSNYPYPIDAVGRFDITWNRLRKVMLVYERFNEETKGWEFVEPIGLEELSFDKNADDDE